MVKIRIRNEQTVLPASFAVRRTIRRSIRAAVREMGGENCEVSVLICDNSAIRELNAAWRNIDRETDVLSFPMEDDSPLLGDIVLSLEKACEQAQSYGHSTAREIGFLTVHSMLHLYGYDHIEEADRVKMREMEEKILTKLKFLRDEAQN